MPAHLVGGVLFEFGHPDGEGSYGVAPSWPPNRLPRKPTRASTTEWSPSWMFRRCALVETTTRAAPGFVDLRGIVAAKPRLICGPAGKSGPALSSDRRTSVGPSRLRHHRRPLPSMGSKDLHHLKPVYVYPRRFGFVSRH
jgi:hypothetical protein